MGIWRPCRHRCSLARPRVWGVGYGVQGAGCKVGDKADSRACGPGQSGPSPRHKLPWSWERGHPHTLLFSAKKSPPCLGSPGFTPCPHPRSLPLGTSPQAVGSIYSSQLELEPGPGSKPQLPSPLLRAGGDGGRWCSPQGRRLLCYSDFCLSELKSKHQCQVRLVWCCA